MHQLKEIERMKIGKIIAIGAGTVILSVGGGMVGSSLVSNEGDTSENLLTTITDVFAKEEPDVTVPFELFLTNLKSTDEDEGKYALQIEIAVGVKGEENAALITEKTAVVRDSIIRTLSVKNHKNVMETDENGNLILKKELKSSLNDTLGDEIVTDIFITNVVQQRTK